MSVYTRRFDTEQVTENTEEFIFSRYLLQGYSEAIASIASISSLENKNDLCVIGVTYKKSGKGGGDTQIFVTGKCKKDETLEQTVVREIGEETRFSVDQSMLKFIKQVDNVSWYSLHVSALSSRGTYPRAVKSGDTTNKIACIIYGTSAEIGERVRSLAVVNGPTNDDIVGIAWLRISLVKEVVSIIGRPGGWGLLPVRFRKG